jgi:hypothetical protein
MKIRFDEKADAAFSAKSPTVYPMLRFAIDQSVNAGWRERLT